MATRSTSADTDLPLDSYTGNPDWPFSQLIADTLRRRRLPLRDAAELITNALWDDRRYRGTVSHTTIHGWIHDGHVPGQKMRPGIARGLGIPFDQLNAAANEQKYRRRSRSGHRQAAHTTVEQSDAPVSGLDSRTPPDSVDSDDVKRRQFGWWLATAGAAVASMDFERTAAILAGTRPDHAALDAMETLTRDLIQREATLPPLSLLPAVQGHLQGMRDVLIWTPADLAPRAHSVAGQTALLAGYLMLQQDRRLDADTYWSLAERFAVAAGDVRLRAALRVHQAWRWEDEKVSRSLALLDQALSLLGPNPDPAAAAMVLSVRAARHADASRADSSHTPSALSDLEIAQVHLSRMSAHDDRLYAFRSVTFQAIDSRADTFRNLGQDSNAAAEFALALAYVDPSWSASRSWATCGLAATMASMGDYEHACNLLTASLQQAEGKSVLRLVRYIRDKYRPALGGYDGLAARRLEEQLRSLEASLPGLDS